MSSPFIQFYVGDYLRKTRGLTTEQHGAYLLLLMTAWNAGGRLPNDPRKLARFAGCTPSRWTKIGPDVLAFFDVEGDEIVNSRLVLELEKASEKSIKRAVSGGKGGRAKALKDKGEALAIATDLPWHSSEPEPEPDKKKEAIASSALDFEAFWTAYPRKVAKGAARKAYLAALKRIRAFDPAATILAGLIAQAPAWSDPRFIPHPTTWLNGDRWADEPPADSTTSPTPGGPHGPIAGHAPTPAALASRANTESRRSAWIDEVAGMEPAPPPGHDGGGGGGVRAGVPLLRLVGGSSVAGGDRRDD